MTMASHRKGASQLQDDGIRGWTKHGAEKGKEAQKELNLNFERRGRRN
jgi:hypothetical protein